MQGFKLFRIVKRGPNLKVITLRCFFSYVCGTVGGESQKDEPFLPLSCQQRSGQCAPVCGDYPIEESFRAEHVCARLTLRRRSRRKCTSHDILPNI